MNYRIRQAYDFTKGKNFAWMDKVIADCALKDRN